VAGTRRSLEKEAFWRKILARQRRSGLSVREFCQGEGVSEGSFYAWRRELLKRDAATPDVEDNRDTERRLVRVKVVSDGETVWPTQTPNMLEILTPEGLTLRFDARTRPETVAALVDVITQGRVGRASC